MITILLNPSAGGGRAIRRKARLKELFRDHNISCSLVVTESEDHLKALSREMAAQGRTIVGAGGDSTFHLIINEIMKVGGRPAFGMLGLGSSNDITQEFGLEPLEKAVAALKRGCTKAIDLGCILQGDKSPRYFLGQANIGLGVAVNRYVNRLARRRRGLARLQTLAGALGILRAFWKQLVPLPLSIRSEEGTTDGRFTAAVFSNTRYWATGRIIAPQARPDDGRLDACLIAECSLLRLARINSLATKGRHGQAREVRFFQSAEFTVSSPVSFDIQADGELVSGPGPLVPRRLLLFQVRPAALEIIV